MFCLTCDVALLQEPVKYLTVVDGVLGHVCEVHYV